MLKKSRIDKNRHESLLGVVWPNREVVEVIYVCDFHQSKYMHTANYIHVKDVLASSLNV